MASTSHHNLLTKNSQKDDSKEEQNSSSSSSHKITTFFPVLRGEGRAKMCASKLGDTKQKEILQKLKKKDGISAKDKNPDSKSFLEQSQKTEHNTQTKEKLRGSIMSVLKTPLSQVLRKNIEAGENKKDQSEVGDKLSAKLSLDNNMVDKKESKNENPVERLRSNQRAKKSFNESEKSMSLRRQSSHAAKSFSSSLRSKVKKNAEQTVGSSDSRKEVSETNEPNSNKNLTVSNVTRQLSFSNTSATSSNSPADESLNQSGNSYNSTKKNKRPRRHFRGGTYGLYLTKRKKRKIMKSNDESKDDNCSLAGTENSSYLDSDEGNSIMSEDLYTPSEKSLADEEHNADSQSSPVQESSDPKPDPAEVNLDEDKKSEDTSEQQERSNEPSNEMEDDKILSTVVSECSESNLNAADALEGSENMQWEDSNNMESEKQFSSENIKNQYDDISNESFSNTVFPSKESTNDSSNDKKLPSELENEDTKTDFENDFKNNLYSETDSKTEEAMMTSSNTDALETLDSNEEIEKNPSDITDSYDQQDHQIDTVDSYNQDDKLTNVDDSYNQDDKLRNIDDSYDQNDKLLSSADSYDHEDKLTDELKSGDEQDSESVFSPGQSPEIKDSNDNSTIATCVKSRQRIKRRFTDDVVDTEVGLLSLNPMPAPRKVPAPRPDPPKDVIETFQSVTHSEAKKGPITKIEVIFNSRQQPVMSCTCEGDTYEANLGDEEEGVFCQAVDSIDDKLVGCSNPVVTTRLVRSSVKIPFTIMCEMHLWRLKHHHSCPYCGLFCSQGSFMQCVSLKNKRRVVHLYHEQCQSKEEGIGTFCLHCGATSGLKRATLEMHMASPPSFFLSQLTSSPLPHVDKARISISSAAERMKDDEIVDFSYRIEDTGKVLSSVGLKNGPEKDELDKLLRMMNENQDIPNYHTHDEFYAAAAEGDLLKVLNILARGIDPNLKFPDHEDETALHAAAANGQTTVVHLLIQAGAVNDSLNERTYTPLMLAVENNHKDAVFYLIKNGSLADFKGESGMSSFHMAAKNGNLDVLKILMSSRNVDINSQDDGGWTPIVWASEHDHYEVVKYLLKRGANPNIKDSEGNTGLHWSAFSGSVDISYLYLDYGCDINATNERGDTPLHIAARQDALSCVTLFLSRGADVQVRNKNNLLPAECVIDKTSDTYLSLSLNMLLKKIAGKYQHKAEKILHKDISRGKEQIAIPCVNEVDDEPPPLDFLYVTENCETTPLNIDRTITSLQSCNCEDDCSSSNCVCSSISYQCWYDKEGLLLPNFNLVDPPMLFECNRACSCWALSCRNRVLQNGITCRLQLIRTKGKGWGVRTLKDIPKGTFICEYVGEMISDSAADKRADDSYLFDLDNRDGETYCLDARYYGNISRFINHLCEPNLVPVKIYVDHQDLNFPRIAFFSSRDIKQYEELGFDYCEKFWVIKYKYFTCDCGSAKCKYSKDTIHHTLANYYRRVREEQQLEEGTLQPAVVSEP